MNDYRVISYLQDENGLTSDDGNHRTHHYAYQAANQCKDSYTHNWDEHNSAYYNQDENGLTSDDGNPRTHPYAYQAANQCKDSYTHNWDGHNSAYYNHR